MTLPTDDLTPRHVETPRQGLSGRLKNLGGLTSFRSKTVSLVEAFGSKRISKLLSVVLTTAVVSNLALCLGYYWMIKHPLSLEVYQTSWFAGFSRSVIRDLFYRINFFDRQLLFWEPTSFSVAIKFFITTVIWAMAFHILNEWQMCRFRYRELGEDNAEKVRLLFERGIYLGMWIVLFGFLIHVGVLNIRVTFEQMGP